MQYFNVLMYSYDRMLAHIFKFQVVFNYTLQKKFSGRARMGE